MDARRIKQHADIIGAEGVHIGTVDRVEGDRIKMTRADSGSGGHKGHHHYIPLSLVADVEDGAVRLSAKADVVAANFEEEQGGKPV